MPSQTIQTIDTDRLARETGNIYEAVAILSKRARQVAARTKVELDQKLSYFDELTLEPTDDLRTNEDQLRISLEYERRPKSGAVAIAELNQGEIYYRNPTAGDGNEG
jgi:hypothetical protein